MDMILDVQGFQQFDFILKELAVISVQTDDAGKPCLTRLLFKPPCAWETLSAKCKATNAWLTRNYHGISWNDGNIPYDDVQKVVKRVVEHANYIYVKGEEKKKWIEKIINDESRPVIELGELGCPSLQMLQHTEVVHWHGDRHGNIRRYQCAFENVQRLKTWYLTECSGSRHKSMHTYLQVGSLARMKAEDIAYLSKDFILIYGRDVIDEVWDKLSEAMKKDADIAECRKCRIHHKFDGPIPMIKNCAKCKMNQLCNTFDNLTTNVEK